MNFDMGLAIISVALSFAVFVVDKRKRVFLYFFLALLVLSSVAFAVRQYDHSARIVRLTTTISESVSDVPRSAEDIYEAVSHEVNWETFNEALFRCESLGKVVWEPMEFQTFDHRLVKVRLYSRPLNISTSPESSTLTGWLSPAGQLADSASGTPPTSAQPLRPGR